MKIVTILILSVILLVGAVSCQSTSPTVSSTFPLATSTVKAPGARVIGGSGVITYEPISDIVSLFGAEVNINLTFKSGDSEPVIMDPYPPQITISPKAVLQNQSSQRLFPAGSDSLRFSPGESKDYTLVWDQKDDNGQQVSYGLYGVEMKIKSHREKSNAGHGSTTQVTKILIQPIGGAQEKILELNQTQTSGDLSATLKKIELSALSNKFYTFVAPPNFYYDDALSGGAANFSVQYRIDNGDWMVPYKGDFSTSIYDTGIGNGWDLPPIPKDVQSLSIRISTGLNSPVPIEFKVPLD